MKLIILHYCLVFIEVTSIVQLSYQHRCPFTKWEDATILSTLAKLDVKDYVTEQNKNFIGLKSDSESSSTAVTIETLLKTFQPNNIKEYVSNGEEILKNVYKPHVGPRRRVQFECSIPPISCFNGSQNFYFRSYDGACNNLAHPGYGMAKTRYSRIAWPKYGDRQYTPSKSSTGNALPSPRVLSLSLYGEDTFSDSFRTLMTMQFGQFVAHDISQLAREDIPDDCCLNPGHKLCYPIPLHPFGPIAMTLGKTCLSFSRSLSDRDVMCTPSNLPYAEKISTTTSYLDLSSVYGNSLEENRKVRQYKGGLLKTSWYNDRQFLPLQSNLIDKCPANNDHCYNIPDNRNQFTPIIAVIQTIFVREHNRLATILSNINPQYSDESIFQVARKINIAQFQKITFYDWLPLIIGQEYSYVNRLIYSVPSHEYVNDYDETWDPSPFAEYAAAAFRYVHQTIPGWFSLVSSGRNRNQTMRLSDYFDRKDTPDFLKEGNNFDSLIRGLATQLEKTADSNVDREIKHHFDRKIFDEFGTDLKAIDIQRGRDFGLGSYNDYREYCGLPRANRWDDLLNEITEEKINKLKKLYTTLNDIELSVGGSYETHSTNSIFGPTFQCIIGKQFLKTRVADRFFYEHEDSSSGFTKEQLSEIRKVSFAGILCANGNNLQCIQPNVFVFPNYQNKLISCKTIHQLNLLLWGDNALY